jgi:hypothetical protein
MPKIIKGGLPSSGGTISGPLTINGAFTSLGIDDNATKEVLEIADGTLKVGASGANYSITNKINDQNTIFSGGSGETSGSNIVLFGGAHATLANDIQVRAGASIELRYDDSASTWDFQLNQVLLDQATADNGFVNYQATIDADATSAISSLTTSGAVTHHIQFEINGATFWIAGSTTDPS